MSPTPLLITVILGDITRQNDCDAIVNAANGTLRAGGGVCGAIHRAAGPELQVSSIRLAPIGVGEAVVTPGFNLPNRLVIHTVGPRYAGDSDPPGHLAAAMRNSLLLADREKVERIAVPAISMGIFGYPPAEAVPVLVKTAREMSGLLQQVREVRFVVLDEELFKRFSNEIQKQKG